jgi:uncharacterized protein YxjI
MVFAIKERIISLRSTYDIVTPDGNSYTATKKIFSLFPNLQVINAATSAPVVNLKGGFALFSQKYDFIFTDGRTYHYKTEQRLKPVYAAEGNGETYRLYRHRGVKFSIFKGDTQIAAITKNRIAIGSGNEYQVQINSDADPLIVSSMILAFNSSKEDNKKGAVSVDVGYMGLEEKHFDTSWQPS